ncbi:hypothetical protein MUN89_04990 [Halobacillus salinarum]|uniref:Uncharacterized protein n=1 Tax=Halobacillus salinarum TaxID=2932257 RepID=A0ABY4ELH3_9BACI|nr:hypothetical protein [Halobacillus salinarum]UOQ45308.1 hypothetical protein MUN89_04990 [Halobacillus salinarum]
MNKKMLAIIGSYAVIMGLLLILTFSFQWNPSGYDYTIGDQSLTVEKGWISPDENTINVEGKQAEMLQFLLALSVEREHWRQDVTVIGLLLPFVLFLFYKQRRPFKNQVSYSWYVTIILAITALYAAYSTSGHLKEIEDIRSQLQQLLA